jgi:DNA-binding protein H-NS
MRHNIAEYRLAACDLALDSLGGRRLLAKPLLPPKYQGLRTGKTWSDCGKPPKWIAGKNRERFLIP